MRSIANTAPPIRLVSASSSRPTSTGRAVFVSQLQPGLSSAEAIAERYAVAKDLVRTELHVIVDQVQPHLRAEKGVVPDIGAKSGANVSHEMVAAGVIAVAKQGIEVQDVIEAEILTADATQHLAGEIFSQAWRPHCIEAIENRTVRFLLAIQALTCLPEQLALEAYAAADQQVSAEARVQSAALAGEGARTGWTGAGGGAGGTDATDAESCVESLPKSTGRKQAKHNCDRNKH